MTEADGRATGLELADGRAVEADVVVAGAPLPGQSADRSVRPARHG